jgi:6-phosphofructokinase 1
LNSEVREGVRRMAARIGNIGVFTSGGDAQGMNAALRAVVRTAEHLGIEVFAIYEGYQGMVDGGDKIRPMRWNDAGGILHQGGTVIGTARCERFRERDGRRQALRNLVINEIDSLVVIGGDGSLTGADILREEWPGLLQELVDRGDITAEQAAAHPSLRMVGIVGSIDNDMFGTDMTIGTDSALHRIVEAVDSIASTAASHQRAFVIEVMGRNCGYLALMSALATAANWVFIPEDPPPSTWREDMCEALATGRRAGNRHSIVIVAEGARDADGQPITSDEVRRVINELLDEDTRVTILGHVQRGGRPSAFDRNLGTLMGYHAVHHLAASTPADEPVLIGIHENDVVRSPLMHAVQLTQSTADAIRNGNYAEAMRLRGGSFVESVRTMEVMVRAGLERAQPEHVRRLGVVHVGAPAPGMNTAVRVTVRLANHHGHQVIGIRNGFEGFLEGDLHEMTWDEVSTWVSRGGAELGTSRLLPAAWDFQRLAQVIADQRLDSLLFVGGWTAYEAAIQMVARRDEYPALRLPILLLPASINNNLPASEFSVGADTALNSIMVDVDKIKQSAVATKRSFVVEVMGRYCGYLAQMSGIACGVERVYMHEDGLTLDGLKADLDALVEGFRKGKRLGMIIRNEYADPFYTTQFIVSLFEKEGGELFDVRGSVLGHLQQGGDPTPFDRIQATRMATRCLEVLLDEGGVAPDTALAVGLKAGRLVLTPIAELPALMDMRWQRPVEQWWRRLGPVAQTMAQRPETV